MHEFVVVEERGDIARRLGQDLPERLQTRVTACWTASRSAAKGDPLFLGLIPAQVFGDDGTTHLVPSAEDITILRLRRLPEGEEVILTCATSCAREVLRSNASRIITSL